MASYGKAAGSIAGTAIGGPLGGMVGGFVGGLADSIFGSDSPEWKDVNFEGVNTDDSRLYMKGPGANAYGQDVARENMNRYGFQGVYQKFLTGENQRLKDEEGQRIMKMASSLTPGAASLRSGVVAQGVGGAVSNVMANAQRESMMGKALDTGFNAMETSNNRLDSQFLTMTGQNEGLRFGASQDLMKSMGLQTEGEMGTSKFNAGMYGDMTKFNTQGEWEERKFNATGRMGQENLQYEGEQSFDNSMMNLLGQGAGYMFGQGKGFSDPLGIQKGIGGLFGSGSKSGYTSTDPSYTPQGRGRI